MNNIILIGMPASGKSVTGVLLATTLKMGFVDIDLLIQKKSGKTLQEVLDQKGLSAFKQLEESVLIDFTGSNTVVATGGSAVYCDEGMAHLKSTGIIVYLEAELKTIKKRLKNIRTRGVALEKGQTLEELYNMRKPLYEKYADIKVGTGANTVEDSVEAIANTIRKTWNF